MVTSGILDQAPRAIRECSLLREGGFAVFDGVPNASTFADLFREAATRYSHATVQESWDPDREEVRGGTPRRSLLSAEAGPAQDGFYYDPLFVEFLSSACGVPVRPSGSRGSYSYYVRPGDFLDLHRDIETCDVAVITAVHDNSAPNEDSGSLIVYPERTDEPLSALRAAPYDGAYAVKLLPGQTVILLGGIVPHRVAPVRARQVRIVSVLCFAAQVDDVSTVPLRDRQTRFLAGSAPPM